MAKQKISTASSAGSLTGSELIPALQGGSPRTLTPQRILDEGKITASGGSAPRTFVERAGDKLTPYDRGAVGDGVTDDTAAIQAWINAATPNRMLDAPRGTFLISSKLTVQKGYIRFGGDAKLVASDSFTDDYMIELTNPGDTDWFTWPLQLGINLDCRFKTRGIRSYRADHNNWNNVRIERPYGHAIKLERWRESLIELPLIMNGQARQAFSDPSGWDSATAYTAGTRVRVVDADWASGTSYTAGNIVRGSDGARYIAVYASTGSDPTSTPAAWAQIPHEDYLCITGSTNKNPQTFNMNNGTSGNRLWQRVYQDEAAIEVNDTTIDGADRTNQVTFLSPIVRDCGHKCYFRIDTNKNNRPITHLNIICGHLHNTIPTQTTYPEVVVSDMQRILEIGYAINVNVIGTNIRLTQSSKGIGVLIGDGGTTKTTQNVRMDGCAFSGEAAGAALATQQRGVIIMPSCITSGGNSRLTSNFTLAGADSTDIIDSKRFFRFSFVSEILQTIPYGLPSRPVGLSQQFNASYTDVAPLESRFVGDANPRIRFQITSTQQLLLFGDGTNSVDVSLARTAANRLTLASGDSFQIAGGAYNTGLLMLGSYRLWVDTSGRLRIKASSDPTSDTDGTVVGTQT